MEAVGPQHTPWAVVWLAVETGPYALGDFDAVRARVAEVGYSTAYTSVSCQAVSTDGGRRAWPRFVESVRG